MDRAGLNKLEHELAHRGEFVSFVLLFVPLTFELFVRYGAAIGSLFLLAEAVIYFALLFLRTHISLDRNSGFAFVITSYFLAFAALTWLLSVPLSPLLFIGVILSAFMSFVFALRGTLFTIICFDLIIIGSVLLHRRGNLDSESLAELISTLCILSLLIYFVTNLIRLTQDQVDEVSRTYQQLKAEHLRLVSLINTLGDAIIATDREGRIQIYNGAALELLDTNSSLSGKRLDDMWALVDSEDKPVKLITESTRLNQNFRRSDLVIKYSEIDRANLYVNVTPIKVGYGAGAERGFTFIMRDITKEKSLDEERDEFISVVSHELRTPITITEGKISNAQLLIEKPRIAKSKIVESLSAAHEQVVFLSNMINDLAALSRAERDDTEMNLEKVEPAKLISDLVKGYEIEAKQKGLSLGSHIYGHPLPALFTSRLYLQEILQNFLTNALKYTKQGGVTVSAKLADNGQVEFAVSDTGIGINTSDLKRIFEKFFRSEDYRTRENSGTGLGLYVTLKLAKKINARIDVKSKLNEGSTFTLLVGSLLPPEGRTSNVLSTAGSRPAGRHFGPSN